MAQPKLEDRLYSEEEYLAFEDASDEKHEFWFGHIVPWRGEAGAGPRSMAGASRKHNSLAGETITALNNRLRGSSCRAGGSDLRILLENGTNYVYPDVAVWCRDARWAGKNETVLLTPMVLVEVLSSGTAITDLTTKLENYRSIPTLCDYLIISQFRVYIQHYRRSPGAEFWVYRDYNRRDQTVRLAFQNLEIPVDDFYFDVDVPEQLVLWEDED